MGMGGGSHGGAVSEINVTPLIDVLLVLLIIFMVIVPVTPKGLDTLVPQPPKNKSESEPNDRTIVVQVGRLRRKMEADSDRPELIKSVRGAGYVLVPEVAAE